MVTKLGSALVSLIPCLILAKNHMVTKPTLRELRIMYSLILAKNHMVTKPSHLMDWNN